MNAITITSNELTKTISEIQAMAREQGLKGLTRVVYEFDATERYTMLLQPTNLGFSISGTLNGATAYQLNGQFFSKSTEIGQIVMRIAGLSKNETLAYFLQM